MTLELWPEWVMRAACRGAKDWEDAFGSAEQQHAFVAAHCVRCWVKPECWAWGRDEYGVFGGTTQKARSQHLGRKVAHVRRVVA